MNHGYVNRNKPTGDIPQVPDRRLRPHQADRGEKPAHHRVLFRKPPVLQARMP